MVMSAGLMGGVLACGNRNIQESPGPMREEREDESGAIQTKLTANDSLCVPPSPPPPLLVEARGFLFVGASVFHTGQEAL